MARTALNPQRVTSLGLEAVPTAAGVDGHTMPPGTNYTLLIVNDDAADVTMTVPTPGMIDGNLAVGDRSVTITAGEMRFWNGQNKPEYIQTDGTVWLNFSAVANVNLYLLRT